MTAPDHATKPFIKHLARTGASIHDYRRDGGRPLGLPKGRARGKLAASPAGAQATDVVGHRTRQQNGARDLGHADEGRRLSGSCRCNALIHDRTVQPRKRRARGEVDER